MDTYDFAIPEHPAQMSPSFDSAADPPPEWATTYTADDFPPWALTADVVPLRADPLAEDLQALAVVRGEPPFRGELAWPGGFVNWAGDRSASVAAERELREETGLWPSHDLIELGTYDESGRDPRQFAGRPDPASGAWNASGVRIVSKAFLALYPVDAALAPRPGGDASAVRWVSVYSFLPWEDVRSPATVAMIDRILRVLHLWAEREKGDPTPLKLEIDRLFSRASWNEEEPRARWDTLVAANLVGESSRDRWGRALRSSAGRVFGDTMAFDHRTILVDALGDLRLRLKRDPRVAHALLPHEFRLSELQLALEAVIGRRLYRSNFRRAIQSRPDLLLPSGKRVSDSRPGKPAELFSFHPDQISRPLNPHLNLPYLPIGDEAD